ncbi:hypothetical protein V8B97DRAFT_2002596 [Scleroderma yunnanense]
MRSFIALAVFVTSVLAAPLVGRSGVDGAVAPVVAPGLSHNALPAPPALPPTPIPAVSGPVNVKDVKVSARDETTIPAILSALENTITPVVDEILDLVPATATVAIVTGLLNKLANSILSTVPQLTALVGLELNAILKDVSGVVLTVEALAQAVFNVVCLILKAVAHIVAIIDCGPGSALFVLIASVLQAVLAILQVIVQLVPAIVASLGPLLAPYVQLITTFKVTGILTLLNL